MGHRKKKSSGGGSGLAALLLVALIGGFFWLSQHPKDREHLRPCMRGDIKSCFHLEDLSKKAKEGVEEGISYQSGGN